MESDDTRTKDRHASHLGTLAFPILLAAYTVGIWLGLWSTYGDIAPGWDRIHFAVIITLLPFLLPLLMNFASIVILKSNRHKPTGIVLLACSAILATLIGLFVVPMGNF